jgi:hypothetical protein
VNAPFSHAAEGVVAMIMEYWLAAFFAGSRLRLGLGRPAVVGELRDSCRAAASRRPLPARQLYQAQDFAVRVWWRFGMVAIVLLLPVIGITAAVRPGQAGLDVAVDVGGVLVCVTLVALALMGVIRFRSARTRHYLRKAGPEARDKPLPPGALGLPRPLDFWMLLTISGIVFLILFYASGAQPASS